MSWKVTAQGKPVPGIVVETKIDDANGVRNYQILKYDSSSGLWFVPDGSTYVYYQPTHWRYV